MDQLIILSITIILLVSYFYSLFYKTKKQTEYQNDERWQNIQTLASKIGYAYFQGLLIIISILITLFLFFPTWNINISLDRALMSAFYLIILGQLVELGSLKYYDKKY